MRRGCVCRGGGAGDWPRDVGRRRERFDSTQRGGSPPHSPSTWIRRAADLRARATRWSLLDGLPPPPPPVFGSCQLSRGALAAARRQRPPGTRSEGGRGGSEGADPADPMRASVCVLPTWTTPTSATAAGPLLQEHYRSTTRVVDRYYQSSRPLLLWPGLGVVDPVRDWPPAGAPPPARAVAVDSGPARRIPGEAAPARPTRSERVALLREAAAAGLPEGTVTKCVLSHFDSESPPPPPPPRPWPPGPTCAVCARPHVSPLSEPLQAGLSACLPCPS